MPLVPVTRTRLGRGVYLETLRTFPEAVAALVGDAVGRSVDRLAGTGVLAAVPTPPPILWQPAGPRARIRVLLPAFVCLRTGYLEHLLSHGGKMHESILASEADARWIHAALLAAGANPGRPARFRNDKGEEIYEPPTGDRIRVLVQYTDPTTGQLKTVPARRWVRNSKTKKELDIDWVFAGSFFFKDSEQKLRYAANDGRVICVTNFVSAMLDLPVRSPDASPQDFLDYEANTPLIPPLRTPVMVILEPIKEVPSPGNEQPSAK